ncbi:MAG TPA: STAS domain-containing protein [Acidimicrobiales bacterium]
MEALSIEQDREGDAVVMRVRGELDRLTSDSLDLAVRELAAQGSPVLVLDVRELEFIDSAGLRSLSRAHNLLQSGGRAFVLRAPSPTILRLLEVVGLRDILTIEVP